ncbi:MAG: TIGR00730 family Rossman fold protein [Bacilli bacterium]|nr:TIGR00730 family Rossman fold protein [Bacilli bacterium]
MNVAVFLGAQKPKNEKYVEQVIKVAETIGKKGHNLVFGGSSSGTMSVLAKAAKENGVHITGIIPTFFKDIADGNNDEIEVVPTMGIRKERMAELADIFIILPGGLGTLEEAADVISWKRMGITKGKTIFVSYEGFYDPLLTIIDKMIEEEYILDTVKKDIIFVKDASELDPYL